MRTRSRLSAGVAACLVVSAAELAAQGPLLSSEEFERLMGRMTGTWELQPEKSMATSIPFPGLDSVSWKRTGRDLRPGWRERGDVHATRARCRGARNARFRHPSIRRPAIPDGGHHEEPDGEQNAR